MSSKPVATQVSSIVFITRTKTACYLKNCLLTLLLLPVLLGSLPANAETDPLVTMNAGLNDSWYDPLTDGQGFFIAVFPDLGKVTLAWFTYDTVLPPLDAPANLGDPGHRWLTAIGPIDGNQSTLRIVLTSGGIFDTATGIERTDPPGSDGYLTLTFDSCSAGSVEYDMPSINKQGIVPIQRVAGDNIALCQALAEPEPNACTRPEPDLSHGPDDPPIIRAGSTLERGEIIDGGPGQDGIPSVDEPQFTISTGAANLAPTELVVGVKVGNDIRAYPHRILNWHEVVNDQFSIGGDFERATLSYCPLTGSAVLWKSFMDGGNETFGTSGLLYNSNLIMYDRETGTLWSQMLERAVKGPQVNRIPDRLQVVETTWETWQKMYPDTLLLTENTGYSRDYNDYPYGSYREDNRLLFPVDLEDDKRLHRKERVLGINVGTRSKVYPIVDFANGVDVYNDTVGDMQVVVAGSSGLNFGVVFNRQMEDCTVLEFEAVQNRLPVVMRDNEGNEWDVFGTAVSGERTGQQLQKTNSYISYWFAWTAFFSARPPDFFMVSINQ